MVGDGLTPNCLSVHVSCLIRLLFSNIAAFPDSSNEVDDFNLIITDRNSGQKYASKTQVVITWNWKKCRRDRNVIGFDANLLVPHTSIGSTAAS